MDKLNKIEEALADIKAGKIVIVVDDENRENEGDFVVASRFATPEVINFMAKYGRGLICISLTSERCQELDLQMMVNQNTSHLETAFTVSVDLKGYGTASGISASDRSKTILALINPEMKPQDFGRPGHIFPLKAANGGVLRRTGHTEASLDLSRMAGFEPSGVLVEIMNEDGTMARLPQLFEIAKQHDLKIISIEDLIAYRLEHESLIKREIDVQLPTDFGDFELVAYTQITNQQTHLALIKGQWDEAWFYSSFIRLSRYRQNFFG
jgi:3,4-dihydroxy 2-butanone 4-phosphate synthase/GTP cyclohydrolase II